MADQLFLFVILLWQCAERKSFLKDGERTLDHMIFGSVFVFPRFGIMMKVVKVG